MSSEPWNVMGLVQEVGLRNFCEPLKCCPEPVCKGLDHTTDPRCVLQRHPVRPPPENRKIISEFIVSSTHARYGRDTRCKQTPYVCVCVCVFELLFLNFALTVDRCINYLYLYEPVMLSTVPCLHQTRLVCVLRYRKVQFSALISYNCII